MDLIHNPAFLEVEYLECIVLGDEEMIFRDDSQFDVVSLGHFGIAVYEREVVEAPDAEVRVSDVVVAIPVDERALEGDFEM